MELNKKVHKGLILFLFCIFLYPPMLRTSSVISYAWIYGIPTFFVLLNIKVFEKVTVKQFILISAAVLLIILSFVYPALHQTNDYSYVKTATFVFRKLLVFLFLGFVIIKEYSDGYEAEHFMLYYAWTHAVYVIGTIVLVVFPFVRNIWFSIFYDVVDSEDLIQSFGYTFRIGWQGFAGYRLTLHCSIACIFLLFLYFVGGKKIKLSFAQFFVPYFLSFMGNMFYGRSGLVITLFSSVIALLVWNEVNIKRSIKYVGVAVLFFLVIYNLRNISFFSNWYYWMTTPIKNLLTTGSFNNVSFSTTRDMIFMPKWKTLLFGDGYYMKDGHYYMETDSGVMRNILFWGIIGALVSYGMTFLLILDLKKRNWLLFALMLVCFVAFEFKGDVYYEFISLLLAISFVESIGFNNAKMRYNTDTLKGDFQ